MRGKLMDDCHHAIALSPYNALNPKITKHCLSLSLHFPSLVLYFYASLTFSCTPLSPSFLLSPCFCCRQMLATVFSEQPVLATWTRPWNTSKMALI